MTFKAYTLLFLRKAGPFTAIPWIVCLLLSFTACKMTLDSPPALAAQASKLVELMDSTVGIKCSHSKPKGCGTGSIIHKFGHTYILTAAHVIRGHTETNRNGLEVYHGTNSWPVKIVSFDMDHDLALLRVQTNLLVGTSIRFIDPLWAPRIGTKLITYGNIHGRWFTFSDGVLSGVGVKDSTDDYEHDQTTLTVYPGSSGSGAFTIDGRYLGMVSLMNSPGVNFIVPTRRIAEWADDNDLFWIFL